MILAAMWIFVAGFWAGCACVCAIDRKIERDYFRRWDKWEREERKRNGDL